MLARFALISLYSRRNGIVDIFLLTRLHSARFRRPNPLYPGQKSIFDKSYTAIATIIESRSIFDWPGFNPSQPSLRRFERKLNGKVLQFFDAPAMGCRATQANSGDPK